MDKPLDLRHFSFCENPYPSLINQEEQFWLNPLRDKSYTGFHIPEEKNKEYTERMLDAKARFERFAPWFLKEFPESFQSVGRIQSPLTEIATFKSTYEKNTALSVPGRFFLKQDNVLPVAGSIKARGGFHSILCIIEQILAKHTGHSPHEDYSCYSELVGDEYKQIFSRYQLVVSSTGNLGLSIGTLAPCFGLKTYVFMSNDAKQWKKDLLRSIGTKVIEVDGDYGKAVLDGREFAGQHEDTFFIDDEKSEELFWGYSVAALELQEQLIENKQIIDETHPLFVYLPCGVGGAPGGIATGLELLFGKNVHCFFGEPVSVPCALLGISSGLYENIATTDIGLKNETIADGLAVARFSELVGPIVSPFLAGCYTLKDETCLSFLSPLYESEAIFMEPSSFASLAGPYLFTKNETLNKYLAWHGLEEHRENIVHVLWGTGGNLVPERERKFFLNS